jgi:aminopeptidase N
MNESIPPYLIAIAVGDLRFQALGPRTGVWAEPSVLERAAAEFVDTERMLEAGETLCGPYRWGRYDLLVLPPSFPFGGMENPKLTFATPTILAGDKSLVSLIAHELAHSWSGNLATNATWRDFWLNEGFTTYLERRIVESLYGREQATMERVLGRGELAAELAQLAPRDQILAIDLKGRDPDAGFTRVPYEKGAALLERLELLVGRGRFDAFLKKYFDAYAFRVLTTADFERDVRAALFTSTGPEPVDLHLWLHRPGLPPDSPKVESERFQNLDQLARDVASGQRLPDQVDASAWSTQEWLYFLRALPRQIPAPNLGALDKAFELTSRANSEIACQWLEMCIRNGFEAADGRLEEFLRTIGRRKFLVPLYGELVKTPEGKRRAREIFAKAKRGYHPLAAEAVAAIL